MIIIWYYLIKNIKLNGFKIILNNDIKKYFNINKFNTF